MTRYFTNLKENPLLFGALIFIFVGWAITFVLAFFFDDTTRGTFGDAFGAVNALFSGLAFVGVIYAIVLQKEELRLQRRELEMTRHEMEGQKAALQAQNETMNRQRFENTFFQMLTLYNQIADSMQFEWNNKKHVGSEAVKAIIDRVSYRYNSRIRDAGNTKDPIKLSGILMESYRSLYNELEAQMGSYFKLLSALFDFIQDAQIENRNFYADLIKANLSDSERLFLFYFVVYSDKREILEKHAKFFSLFTDMPTNNFIYPENDNICYRGLIAV